MHYAAHSKKILPVRALLALALLWLAIAPSFARADENDDRQYKIEAVFLYNFFNYITWPGHREPAELSEATICLYGDDPLLPYLQYVQEKMEGERHLTVRPIHSAQEVAGCQMLFDHDGTMTPVAGVLTVSNQQHYLQKGGMIVLSKEGDHISMGINHTRLTQQGFQVSSRLLKLAEEVR